MFTKRTLYTLFKTEPLNINSLTKWSRKKLVYYSCLHVLIVPASLILLGNSFHTLGARSKSFVS